MSTLTRYVALTVLALWGLASMHCKLEAVPGMEFLRSCCFADSSPSSPQDCETVGCCDVEHGKYRPEDQNASAPQPVLLAALISAAVEVPLPERQPHRLTAPKPPPELSRPWQFSFRTALPPRAPSPIS